MVLFSLLVPWADFNCFQLDPDAIKGKLASITLMSDVLPTALHAVENAEVTVGKTGQIKSNQIIIINHTTVDQITKMPHCKTT